MKPKNRSQLVEFLKSNPNLRWEYPEGVGIFRTGKIENRVFLRMQGGRFVFRTPEGKESHLDAKAKEMEFYDDHFAVKFPPEWKDVPADKKMRYFYKEVA